MGLVFDNARLEAQGVLVNQEKRRFEIKLEDGGSIVGYAPLDGVEIYAYDLRGGEKPDLDKLGLREKSRGRYLRTSVCCDGKCQFLRGERSVLLSPNEGAAEYRVNGVPLSVAADRFCGLELVLALDRLPRENTIFGLMREKAHSFKPEEDRSRTLFFFRMSGTTRREANNVLRMCFSDADSTMVLVKGTELCLRYLDDLKSDKYEQRSFVTKSQLMIAQDMHACLTEHYAERWTVNYFADKYGFSTTSINKYFESVYGYDVKEFQIKVRMERAAEMLRDTVLSVGEISQRVGYSTHAKFGAKFKEKYGMTPLEYRRQCRVAHPAVSEEKADDE